MPFKSKAQRRYLHSQHPKLAAEWEKKYPVKGKLPEHVRSAPKALAKPKTKQ